MGEGAKGRAKRWTEAEARQVLDEWRASGLRAAAFARQKGISAMRLPYWSQRLASSTGGEVSFVAVPTSEAASAVELEHQGVTVRFRSVDADELARVVVPIGR